MRVGFCAAKEKYEPIEKKNWATKTLKKLSQTEINTGLVFAEDKLLKAQSPHQWAKARGWMKEQCHELNDKSGCRILHFDAMPVVQARIRRLRP